MSSTIISFRVLLKFAPYLFLIQKGQMESEIHIFPRFQVKLSNL